MSRAVGAIWLACYWVKCIYYLVLDKISVLLLDGDVPAEGVAGGRVRSASREGLDPHHHLEHGLRRDLRSDWVVDPAGDVAMGMYVVDGQQSPERRRDIHGEVLSGWG